MSQLSKNSSGKELTIFFFLFHNQMVIFGQRTLGQTVGIFNSLFLSPLAATMKCYFMLLSNRTSILQLKFSCIRPILLPLVIL